VNELLVPENAFAKAVIAEDVPSTKTVETFAA
jgi:hypothetical protein